MKAQKQKHMCAVFQKMLLSVKTLAGVRGLLCLPGRFFYVCSQMGTPSIAKVRPEGPDFTVVATVEAGSCHSLLVSPAGSVTRDRLRYRSALHLRQINCAPFNGALYIMVRYM